MYGPFWDHWGTIFGTIGGSFSSLLHTFSDLVRTFSRLLWDHSGTILGSLGDHLILLGGARGLKTYTFFDEEMTFSLRNGWVNALDQSFRYQSTRLGRGTSIFGVLTKTFFLGKLDVFVFGFPGLSVSSHLPM